MSQLVLRAMIAAGLLLTGCAATDEADRESLAPQPAPAAETQYEPTVVTPQEVQARLKRGDAVVIADVRHADGYGREHIEGAVHFPYATLATDEVDLPKDRWIVLYCT